MEPLLRIPRDDEVYSRFRLTTILGRRRLNFNPYEVADEKLLELIHAVGWGNPYDIVQMTVVHFTRLRPKDDWRGFDGIFMRVGDQSDEVFLSLWTFLDAVVALDTLRQTRSLLGRKPLRSEEDVKGLVGHSYFVSRTIRARDIRFNPRLAYHFHRLHGKPQRDAATIRAAMTQSRVEMLERLLCHPEAEHHLDCRPGLFDFATPISAAIDAINRQPPSPSPE